MTYPACFDHRPGWLPPSEADALFAELSRDIAWEQREMKMYGQQTMLPRLTAWYGDRAYGYSGIENAAHSWIPPLAALRDRLSAETGCELNSCLANLYRSGADSVSWHADDEPELGDRPAIASISLGTARDFRVRHNASGDTFALSLGHGDLVVMRDESQSAYKHSIPKRARIAEPRINLTFRRFS